MPVSLPQTALALSFCALALPGLATPAFAQAGDLASQRAYVTSASLTGPSITIGQKALTVNTASVHLSSGPTDSCAATGCATLTNPKTSTLVKADQQPVADQLAPIALQDVISGIRGQSGAQEAQLSPGLGSSSIASESVEVVLDDATLARLRPEVREALVGDVTKLASMLEPLATAAGPGPLADVHAVVRDIAKDPKAHPFLRVTQGASSTSVNATPSANVTHGASEVLVFPTASNQALIRIKIDASTLSAQSPIGTPASGTVTPGKMHVVLLPGLADSLPAAVGTSADLAGTPVAQIINQLPKAASGILGPKFNTTDSGLVLDAETGGLKMNVSPSTDRACWFDSSVLETCVESGVSQRNLSTNGAGVGLVAQPARVGMFRQDLIVNLHEGRIGVNAEPKEKSETLPNTQDRTQPLPRTGSNLPPAWVLILLALASIGVLAVVRPRS